MSKNQKRILGCLAVLLLFCAVSIPVGYIAFRELDEDLEQTKRDVENTVEAGDANENATQQAIATNQKMHQNAVDALWITQTANAVITRQTPTP